MVSGPFQSIVTGLHERSRRGIMDGLRSFIEVDNRSAMDVGGLRRSTISIPLQKTQFSKAFPGAVIIECADELTLRAEELGSLRALTDTKHIELEKWRPASGGRGLARLLLSHLQRNRRRGMGSSVLS